MSLKWDELQPDLLLFVKTYRCYRYGQAKEVFVYRFLTALSMEEKLYKRIVTKHQLAQEVIDGKHIVRMFTRDEIKNLNAEDDTWIECDSCGKWRVLPPGFDTNQLPDKVSSLCVITQPSHPN